MVKRKICHLKKGKLARIIDGLTPISPNSKVLLILSEESEKLIKMRINNQNNQSNTNNINLTKITSTVNWHLLESIPNKKTRIKTSNQHKYTNHPFQKIKPPSPLTHYQNHKSIKFSTHYHKRNPHKWSKAISNLRSTADKQRKRSLFRSTKSMR